MSTMWGKMSPNDRSMVVDEEDGTGSLVIMPIDVPDRVRLPDDIGGGEFRVVDSRAEACVDPRCKDEPHAAMHLVLGGTNVQVCGCKRYRHWLFYSVPT